ncbi:MAG: DsbA family protein [Myxococcales bacterium]|nr:DsbA family protein [Myxococcales bacterium]
MRRAILTVGVLILGLAGCGNSDLGDVAERQKEILEKLAKLEQGQKQLLATRPAARQRPTVDYDKVHKINVGSAPIKGNPNAAVTIVEFSDFQCPFCAKSLPLLNQLVAKYPDQVRLVYKHFPLSFHQQARPAAIASLAAQEQGRFWEYHDVLFANMAKLNTADWEGFAKEAGLDVGRFKQDLAAKQAEYDRRVTADFNDGQKAAVSGTPTVYINGKKVKSRSLGGMSQMIDEALKKGS